MGVHVCEGESATFLYDSVTMRPINTQAFDDAEAADTFLVFASKRGLDLRGCSDDEREALREEWAKLPRCVQCDLLVVDPGDDRPDECAGCRPECEWVRRGSRGVETCRDRGGETVDVERAGTTCRETYCAAHAADVRAGIARAVREERV